MGQVVARENPSKRCEHCGNVFFRYGRRIYDKKQWEQARFCSKQCGGQVHSRPVRRKVCEHCGEMYQRINGRDGDLVWETRRYCSHTCAQVASRLLDTRRCCTCLEMKPVSAFYRRKSSFGSQCKVCTQTVLSVWRTKNLQRRLHHNKRRLLALRAAPGKHTTQEWLALCEEYSNRCAACGKTTKLTRDHIVPVSKDGSNSIENIQPLCQSCNSAKRDQTTDYRLVAKERLQKEVPQCS